jgi:adenylosuccinate synthase
MKVKIVVGLGMGDEGKGITTDYLSRLSPEPTVVVRFSGGQQAGHTVQIGDVKHTYSTFCSGTGRALPSYLSEYCTFYPPNALNEYKELIDKGLTPSLSIHPLVKLTSFWDVAWGRLRERIYNHGSCGIGVGATMMRHEQSPYKLFASDLLHSRVLGEKLKGIGRYYGEKVKDLNPSQEMQNYFKSEADAEMERFFESLGSDFIRHVVSNGIIPYNYFWGFKRFSQIIFEGSQGILLDMEHGVFPNVTYSSTTSKNALEICKKLGIAQTGSIDIYYVTRCYFTRHGKGWFPDVSPVTLSNHENEHNRWNEWQENFRTGQLDIELLKYALKIDDSYSFGYGKSLVVTCLDQYNGQHPDYDTLGNFANIYESWSPDSKDFKVKL